MSFRYVTIDSVYASQTIYHGTFTWGINDNGQIAGYYYPAGATDASSFYELNGAFTYIDPGSPYHNIVAHSISNLGLVGGWLQLGSNADRGFYYQGGSFSIVSDPLGVNGTQVFGASSFLVGTYYDAGHVQHGFVTDDSVNFTTFDFPGASGTELVGTNTDATIGVGDYIGADGLHHGFKLSDNNTFSAIDDPDGTKGTYAFGVNNRGLIVGYYIDSAGATRTASSMILKSFSTHSRPSTCRGRSIRSSPASMITVG
jgi:hypothetical protein